MIVGETLKMMMIKLTLVLKFVIAICLFHSIVSLTLPKKFVLVTGGVLSGKLTLSLSTIIIIITIISLSGVGKGICASSLGVIFKTLNLRPTACKIDPYLNVDAGINILLLTIN